MNMLSIGPVVTAQQVLYALGTNVYHSFMDELLCWTERPQDCEDFEFTITSLFLLSKSPAKHLKVYMFTRTAFDAGICYRQGLSIITHYLVHGTPTKE